MKKSILPLLLLVVSTAVSAQKIIKVEKVTDHSIHVFGNDFDGVIFSKDYQSKWLDFKRVGGRVYAVDNLYPAGGDTDRLSRFTPNEDQVDSAETVLHAV